MKVKQFKQRYIAFLIQSELSEEIDKDIIRKIRKQYAILFGQVGLSQVKIQLISIKDRIAVICVDHLNFHKLISACAFLSDVRLIPVTSSGTIKKLHKKLVNAI
ncbi:MAG: Rpp14/Pop5 family protein [Candidatus Micrarchaeota archaeon]|nr:Rpp14/Pop5 family protein [Candidatus Micrarchaeota archaeon]